MITSVIDAFGANFSSTISINTMNHHVDYNSNFSLSSNYYDLELNELYVALKRTQTIAIPIICVFGVVGNTLSVIVFGSPSLRKAACCYMLASKCVNDTSFLICLFITWLHRVHVSVFATVGLCQVIVFLTYVNGCLSGWFSVAIALEHLIRYTLPHLVRHYCTVNMAKKFIIGSTLGSVLFYNGSLWTSGVTRDIYGNKHCSPLLPFQAVILATTIIDIILTLILPAVIMFFITLMVMNEYVKSERRKKRLQHTCNRSGTFIQKQYVAERKLAKFVFVISMVFFCLNFPSHFIRFKMMMRFYLYQEQPFPIDYSLQRIFEIVLYLNFSVNCLVFLFFGEKLRHVFLSQCSCCSVMNSVNGVNDKSSVIQWQQRGSVNTESACATLST